MRPANPPQPLLHQLSSDATAALLSEQYARIFRIAAALTGSPDVAQKICNRVLKQGLSHLYRWITPDDVSRWFARHTVIASREAIAQSPTVIPPAWLIAAPPHLTHLLAILWSLPMQQREAFLLHHGEGFDLRRLATAMDCSSEAASNHLVAAAQTLSNAANGQLSEFTTALHVLLTNLTPPPQTINLIVHHRLARYRFPRQLLRLLAWTLILSIIAAAVWLAIKLWPMLLF